jgi:DNA modification methylase
MGIAKDLCNLIFEIFLAGTVAVAALRSGRHSISVEKENDLYITSKIRVTKSWTY